MELERRDFRKQLQMFMRWQTENSELRKRIKLQNVQVLVDKHGSVKLVDRPNVPI